MKRMIITDELQGNRDSRIHISLVEPFGLFWQTRDEQVMEFGVTLCGAQYKTFIIPIWSHQLAQPECETCLVQYVARNRLGMTGE